MKFFIDNNLSQQLAAGMAAFGEDVVHLQDRFSDDAKDVDWLLVVGEEGMILVTRDEAIRKNPLEKKALKGNNVGAFFLGGKKQTRCKIIRQLVRHWPRMKELGEKTRRPFAFRIPPSGTKITKIPL